MRFIIATFHVLAFTIGIILKSSEVESDPGVTHIAGGESPIDVNDKNIRIAVGETHIGVNDPSIQNYTSHVMERVNQHDRAMADNVYRGLVEVVNATEQVVAGRRYTMTVLVGKTVCKLNNSQDNGAYYCSWAHGEPRELYLAAILHAPWAKYDGEITIEFLGVQ